MAIMRRWMALVAGRYVDDIFGIDPLDCEVKGGAVVDLVMKLLGLPLDPGKSADLLQEMIILGVLVQPCPWDGNIRVQITKDKAVKWAATIRMCLERQHCDAGTSGKLAGRLQFACTVAADKVGRAYIGPFHAQQNDPLPGGAISRRWTMSARWWLRYLEERGPTVRALDSEDRQTVRCFTDAAGVSRGVAAVVLLGDEIFYCATVVPQDLWDQFIDRKDHQIGVQEALGVALLFGTFGDMLTGKLVLCFVDNDGVRHSLTKGTAKAPEVRHVAGELWLECARRQVALFLARVESKANIADDPSRGDVTLLTSLGAVRREAVWPGWAKNLWTGLRPVCDCVPGVEDNACRTPWVSGHSCHRLVTRQPRCSRVPGVER